MNALQPMKINAAFSSQITSKTLDCLQIYPDFSWDEPNPTGTAVCVETVSPCHYEILCNWSCRIASMMPANSQYNLLSGPLSGAHNKTCYILCSTPLVEPHHRVFVLTNIFKHYLCLAQPQQGSNSMQGFCWYKMMKDYSSASYTWLCSIQTSPQHLGKASKDRSRSNHQ